MNHVNRFPIQIGGTLVAIVASRVTTLLVTAVIASFATSLRAEDIKEREIAFLPSQTEAQRSVRSALLEGESKKALLEYESAYGSFTQTPTGQGFYDYLLFQNGMQASAVERLFQMRTPLAMTDGLQSLWRKTLPGSSPVWKEAHVDWSNAWTKVFSPAAEESHRISMIQSTAKAKDVAALKSMLAHHTGSSDEKAWLEWQIALTLGIQGKSKEAVPYLQTLLDSKQSVISEDQILMSVARLLYQDNNINGALKYYSMIPKSSDLWLESVEEKAWAYMKLKDYEKTLAQVKTLRAPVFAAQVGPEPYFLAGFANYKVCDYNSIFKVLKDFKERFRNRLAELEILAQSGRSISVDAAVQKIESGAKNWSSIGSVVEKLPRVFNRDQTFMTAVSRHGSGRQDISIADQLLSSNQESMSPGLQSRLGDVKRLSQTRQSVGEKLYTQRIKELAAADVKEMSSMIDKMLILQVEAIQHLHADHEMLVKDKGTKPATKKLQASKDDLVFPDSDEVWLDEIDKYHVNAKGCPVKGGRTL